LQVFEYFCSCIVVGSLCQTRGYGSVYIM
jgi:hypothetical protein